MPLIHSVTDDGTRGALGSLIDFSPDLGTSRFCAPDIETAYVTNADVGCVRFAGAGTTTAHVVLIDGGSDDAQVVASTGGRLVLTTNDADNDAIFLGFWGPVATATGTLPFLPVAGTTLTFGIKAKINTIATTDIMFGIGIVDVTPFGGIADAIYFESLGSATVFSTVLEQGDSETTTAMTTTIADDTYFECGFTVTGITNVDNFHDDEVVAASAVTNLADQADEAMAPFVAIRNFDASAATFTIERLSCYQTIA